MCDLLKKIIYSVVIVLSWCINVSAQTVITSSNYEDLGLTSSNYADYLGWYAITSSADLKAFATKVNGGTNSINGVVTEAFDVAPSDFTPIGSATYPFRGTFEMIGGPIKLSAASATTTTSRSYQGLFGYNSGTIKSVRLQLKNVTLKGTSYVGGIAAYNTGTIIGCTISNSGGAIEGTFYVGGIVGYNTGTVGEETMSKNYAPVTGSSYSIGGICGYNSSTGTVYGRNYTDATVTGSSYNVGGICGCNAGTIKTDSENDATVTSTSYRVGGICGYNYGGTAGGTNKGAISGSYYVGGVCGYNTGNITYGTSSTNILIEATAASSYVGGICGYNNGKMIASLVNATGSNVKGVTYVGGVVGYNGSDTVRNFYARAVATVTSTATSGNSYCGGVCGYNAGKLVNVSNYATVSSGANYVGGLAGYNAANGIIDGYRQYANVTGLSYVGGIAGGNAGKINGVSVEPDSYSDPLPVISATSTGKAYVGGICGVNTGTIRYAYPTAVVSGTMIVGGIVGQNSGKISQSGPDSNYSGFSVTATTSTDTARCGGVCGLNLSTGTIDTCHYGDGTVTGNRYIGGMCGDNAGTIQGGSSSSAISSTSGYAGGVCGNNTGTVTKCNAGLYGDVMTLSGARSGGICGNNTGTISYCYVGTRKENFYSDSRFGFSFNGQYAGGICGYSTGTITGCSVTSCSLTSSNTFCGGICGYNTNTISGCDILNSTLSATGYVGGVCGYNEGTSSVISNCSATNGSVTLTGSSYGYAGGVAGRNYGGSISNCYSTVSVSQTGSYSSSYVGGLVGSNSTGSKIEYCYSQGDVTAKGYYVGGLVGYNGAQISNTYAYGNVKSTSYYVGGLIGRQYSGTVTNSYYLADVAIDGNDIVQNGCGASSQGGTTVDPSGVNKKSYFSFASGEVCYLLNGSVNGGSPWGQNIAFTIGGTGPDMAPMLKTSDLVYKITKSGITMYSNSADYEVPASVVEKMATFDGDGSLENPFLIPDLQHLEDFRDIVKAGYRRACGKLTADIVINASVLDENGELRSDYRSAQLKTWIPIDKYQGCFDGDNHTIKGVFCMDVEGSKGLFNQIQSAEIKNLTVSDGYIKTSVGAAGFCVKATSSRISNCHNTCVIFTDGDIPMTGGICGQLVKSTIEKCSNSGNVINTKTGAFFVGGLVGLAEGGCVIRDSYNTGEVAGGWGYGGICGMSQVGGRNLIERCYNTGLVRSAGNSSSDKGAGILGSMDANDVVRNCYNTGTIIGVNVGGIVSNVPATSTVEYCYNAGVINGTTMGGIAGTKTDGATVTYNYYDKTVCSEAGGVNGVELSNQAFGHTTTVLCNSSLSTALNSYYNTAIWQAGTTENASTEIITEDNVFGYKIVGTYPSLNGVGEPQYARTLWVNIGTAENPDWISDFIPIYTIEQLKAVSNELSATYVLMNNVSESKNVKNGELVPSPSVSWTPINNFTGKFYGLGHTISGLYTESSDEYVGLFGITEGAMIKGIKIANSKFVSTHGNGKAGGIVGDASNRYYGGVLSNTSISDCDNLSCTVEANYAAGGIVGSAGLGCSSVEYCRNYGTVVSNYAGTTNYAGGICGGAFGAVIRYCYNEGTISGSGANVGGIAGYLTGVNNCYNIGTLSGGNVGGITGSDGLGTAVNFSYSAGTLSGSGSVGNIIGSVMLGGTTTKCYYDSKNSEYDGVSGSMDREGKVESKTTDELCLALLDGLSSDDWAIKEPEIKDGKKYLYYPYLKHFGEGSAAVGTYRAICKVTLNPNGGTCTPLTQYIEREGATLPQDVERDGYTFGGWYTNASCTSDEVFEIPVTATGEQTFYAKWTANDYAISLSANGGNITSGNVTSYKYGTYTLLPNDVVRTGYTFKGWYPYESCDMVLESYSSSRITTAAKIVSVFGLSASEALAVVDNIPSVIVSQIPLTDAITQKQAFLKDVSAEISFESLVLSDGEEFCDLVLESCGNNKINVIKLIRKYLDLGLGDAKTLADAAPTTILTSVPLATAEAMKSELDALGDVISSYANRVGGNSISAIYSTDMGDKYFGAKWEANTYSVNLQVNGGVNTNMVEEYVYGVGAALPDDTEISREGYTFAGWYVNSNLDGSAVEEITTTDYGDKTYYAKWNVESYAVTLNENEGSINNGNVTSYTYGIGVTLPTDVTRIGYTFGGWYDNSLCSGSPVLSIALNAIDDKEFWAKWDTINYTITYNANEGVFATTPAESYKYGDEVTLPVPTREGYTFAGWYNNSNLVGTEFTQIESTETGNKEFWAKWDVNTYTVSLDAKGGDINSGNVASYTYNVLTILPQDVTKVGHTFEGWFDLENQKVTQISKGTIGDVTFTAKWTAKTYSVTLQANNGTINSGNVTSYTYGLGATLPEDVTKTGYEFLGWFDNSSYDGGKVTKIADNEIGNKNFWAKWTAASYDVTLDANGGTINSNAIERYTYGVGAVLPTDVTKIGYTFKGWKNEENEDALEITSADYGKKTFTAQWEKANYDITYNANGGSINDSYETTYKYGNEITLPTDVTKEGNEFLGWYDNPNFTGEAVSGITTADYGDKTYYAQWSANTYSVTLEPNGGTVNAGAITGYTYGVVASLPTNVTRDGYTFTGWYSDEECEGEVVSIISSTETGNKTFYAGWSNSAYSVTLHTNDGVITSGNVTSYTYGTSVVLPTEIEKTGYTFGGWYDNSSYAGDAVTEISADATGNKTYYARWTVNTYAITLNTNGGNINSGMVASYVYGNGANLPTDVTKTGNTFAGWYADEELTGDQTIRIDEYATGDKTYYAKWTANEYTITYEVVGGSIEDAVYATNYTYGEAVNLPSVVTKSGYTFSGWYTNSAYEGSAITSLSETEYGNRTYYAKWTVNTYEVTLQANEGTVNNGNVSSYTYGVGATLPSDVTKMGYTFMGWYDNDEFAGESVSSIASNATGDKVYYAKWSINNYAVTLNANGGQINSGDVTSYEFGTEVLLPVDVTKAGHTFGGWYNNANLTGESCTAIVAGSTGNKTYYAKWTVNSYTVTLHVNEGTINSGNVTGYIYGSTVILPSDVTKTGNTFGGWYESETFEGDAVSTITASDLGDKTYYAKWTANVYDIILVVNEGTINAGMVESYTYGEGATLPTEVTKEGYSFGGWYSNSSYIGGSVSSIANNDSGDKQYWAKWTINEYEVSAEAENGTVEGTGSYEYKSTATLKATASEGYEFTGWSTGSTETKIQIVVTSDTTVTANFKEKEKVLAVGELEIPTLKTEREAAAIDLSGLFMTSEGSEVSYSASSSAPNVVSASVSEGKLYLTVYEYEGEAEITVKATLPNGEENVVKSTATVVLACNIKVDETITNVSCYGQADGEIALKVTNAAEPYTTLWVSESVTGDTLRGIPASDTYNVEITDAEGCTYTGIYSVTEPSEMKVTGVVKSPTCGNADGSIDITVVGADVASYAWSNGKETEDISTLSKGEYSVTVTNEATGCQVSDSYVLTEPESPVVTVSNVVATACNEANGAVTISVNEEGLIYSWSNNAQTKNLTGVRAGEYTLSVVNPETNCTASIDVTVPSIALKQPEIALVTVSEQTGKNLVVWLKENTNLIDYYTIYRENDEADMYEKLATVPYSELSVYEDEEADPNIRAWRYRITATDVCGTETEQSDHHKTMHITKNAGADGVSNNLIWDEYEGLEFSTFIVMCKHKENGKVVTDTLTTLPSNVTSYTDALPVDNIMSYYVGIKLPSEINPKTQFLKAESGPFALAISNIAEAENEEETGIETLETDIAVYAVGHTIYVNNAAGKQVEVYDVKGCKITAVDGEETMAINVRLAGVYLVNVEGKTFKVIVQ